MGHQWFIGCTLHYCVSLYYLCLSELTVVYSVPVACAILTSTAALLCYSFMTDSIGAQGDARRWGEMAIDGVRPVGA